MWHQHFRIARLLHVHWLLWYCVQRPSMVQCCSFQGQVFHLRLIQQLNSMPRKLGSFRYSNILCNTWHDWSQSKTCHMVHLPKCTTVWQLDCKVVAKLSLSPRSEVIAMEHRRDKLGLSFLKIIYSVAGKRGLISCSWIVLSALMQGPGLKSNKCCRK